MPGTRCLDLLVVHTSDRPAPSLAADVEGAVERASAVFAPVGVSFRFAPDRGLRRTLEPLLDADCALRLPPGRTIDGYTRREERPPCAPEANIRARMQVADSQRGRIVVFHGSGSGVEWDSGHGRWRAGPRRSSHSGYFVPYVTLEEGAFTAPYTLAHELGHFFGLRHPHGPQLADREALERWLCQREPTEPPTLLFDGDRGFVDDTPPDPLPALYAAVGGPAPCGAEADWRAAPLELTLACGPGDTRRLRFEPPPLRANVMSYWDKRCLGALATLTPDQGRAVRRALDAGNRSDLSGKPRPTPRTPAVARFRGHDHVFVTASDGSVRHHWVGVGVADSLLGWLDTANDFAADSATTATALADGARLHLYVVDRSGRVRHKWWDGVAWRPEAQAWEELGGHLGSRVVAVAAAGAEPDLLGRGVDGGVWYRSGATPGAGEWRRMGENGTGVPAALRLGDTLHVVARSRDGTLRHASRQGADWTPWTTVLALPTVDDPSLGVLGAQLVVVARTPAGEVAGATLTNGRWKSWPRPVAAAAQAAPTLVADGSRVRVVYARSDGTLATEEVTSEGFAPATGARWTLDGVRFLSAPAAVWGDRGPRVLAFDDNGDLWDATPPPDAPTGAPRWAFAGRW